MQDDLTVLSVLKQLKYFWSLSQSHLAILLERLAEQLRLEHAAAFQSLLQELAESDDHVVAIKDHRSALSSVRYRRFLNSFRQ